MGVLYYLLLIGFAILGAAQAQDPLDIVRKSLSVDNDYNKRAQDYTLTQKSVEKTVGSDGLLKFTSSKTKDIFFIEGDRYSRLIERDGKPLSPDEEKRERERFEKRLAAGKTAAKRKDQSAEREKRRQQQREFLKELPDAFTFKMLSPETIDGRPVWTIQADPRPDYKPHAFEAKLFSKFRGKLWIDKGDYEWAKMELESIDTVAFGFFLARLAKGAHLVIEQTRLNDEVWLPKRVNIRYDARLALLKHQAGEVEETMYNFRKFQTDSRIVSVSEHQ
ncbi:MAG: hypothetical protein ABI822_28665 [Bryobacteraceae bacterium]